LRNIELQGYKIELPDVPKERDGIYGYDMPKKEQFWSRPYKYTDDEFEELKNHQKLEIIKQETERRVNGFWFYNNGEPFYITGDNYFYLTYWEADNGYPQFIKNQAHEFYFDEMCDKDFRCFGSIKLKPRREGCTERTMARILNKALLNYNSHFGVQSKTGDDAKNQAFAKIVRSFTALPSWMKPTVSGNLNPSKELKFGKPKEQATKNNQRNKISQLYLNTKIDWRSTVSNAYDGSKLKVWVGDEIGKWEEADAYEAWGIVKKTLVDGFDIYGKAYLLSTIGEVSEVAADRFRKIWKESDYKTRTPNGFTESGLYKWFIPAWSTKRGTNPLTAKPILDKYGNVDEEGARAIMMNERKAKKDKQSLMMEIRQNPFNVEEALNYGFTSATFDTERITSRLHYLENFVPTHNRHIKYRVGNLHWVNGERFTKVKFVDSAEGKWKIAYTPDVAGLDKVNRVFSQYNIKRPYSDTQFIIGVDPYDYDNRDEGYSKGAFLIKLKHNFETAKLSNIYCASYCFRESQSEAFYDDVIKSAFYYAAKLNIERHTYGLLKYLKRFGLLGFSMKRPDITKGSQYKDRDNDFGTPSSLDTTKLGIELIENYIAAPDPIINENEKDNLEYFWFDDVLRQMLEYTIKEKTKFDSVSAFIQTELGSQGIIKKSYIDEDKQMKRIIDAIYPKYNTPNYGIAIRK